MDKNKKNEFHSDEASDEDFRSNDTPTDDVSDEEKFDEIVHDQQVEQVKDAPAEKSLPDPNVSDQKPQAPTPTNAGMVVLQWLTYAFWGWTLLAVVWLIYLDVASAMTNLNVNDVIPYAIAGSLVLLPLSFVCDYFFGKHEQTKKHGASMVVMIIHAVIFALFGIGTLIGAVLILVNLLVQTPTDFPATMSWLVTLFVSFVLYALTFVRTLNPAPSFEIAKWYKAVMLIAVGILILIAFVGPVAKSWVTRDDRDIATNLDLVREGVASYVNENRNLPDSLKDTKLDPAAKSLVDRKLVTYKKDGKTETTKENIDYYGHKPGAVQYDYKFQLCVTYKSVDSGSSDYSSYSPPSRSSDDYVSIVSTYGHPSGDVCYKLKAVPYK
jgi:hypothetical protein